MYYPKNQIEFESAFDSEEKCISYLHSIKYEAGFICEKCSHIEYWQNKRSVLVCKKCRNETSVTSGTIFHRSQIPITVLFRLIWFVVIQKTGVSALGIQKVLGLSRYETVWKWLHKIRKVMILPSREKLKGIVEIDETFIGGIKKGKRGRGAEGKEIVIIAIELIGKSNGRVRMGIIEKADRKSINEFVKNNIETGSTIITDGWKGYIDVERMKYKHKIETKLIAVNEENLTPNVHRIASLLKRWLLGTHQNFTSSDYLKYYLDEYTFRYNRRKANSSGLLFYILLKQALLNKPIYKLKNQNI